MDVNIEESWKKVLRDEFEKEYFQKLSNDVKAMYLEGKTVYPLPQNIFNAFDLFPIEKVKVLIIGQDPYHGKGQAHGLSFSVQDGVTTPPSLQNIYKELKEDVGKDIPSSGDLTNWAKQGVLLLNANLTVNAGQPGSHQKLGWETFTDEVIKKISDEKEHVVFLLWGNFARAKASLIDERKHLILEAPHPSPFSARSGFFGCKHFSRTNEYLKQIGQKEIEW